MKPLGGPTSSAAQRAPLETAVKRERKRLFDFIRRRIADEGDAEDVLQDVFYQLLTSPSVTEPIENLTAWLFTVARNKVVDWYRKRRPAPLPEAEGEGPLDLEGVLFDPADGPDRAYWRAAVWTELADALDELPAEQRDVFVAHELEGASFKEIAERTGEPLNTLLSRKLYAVLYLRERLRDPVAHLAAGREPLAPRRRLAPRTVAAALRGETPGHDAGGARALQAGVGPPLRVVACPRARAEARALTCAERSGDLRDRRVTPGVTGPPPAAGDTVSPRPSLDPSRPARLASGRGRADPGRPRHDRARLRDRGERAVRSSTRSFRPFPLRDHELGPREDRPRAPTSFRLRRGRPSPAAGMLSHEWRLLAPRSG